MGDFFHQVKHLNSLFIYKFRIYDYGKNQLKIYYISPDNTHTFLIVDNSPNEDGSHACFYGDLYLDGKKGILFEDTPNTDFFISKQDYKEFKKIHTTLSKWDNKNIKAIVQSFDKNNLDLVL